MILIVRVSGLKVKGQFSSLHILCIFIFKKEICYAIIAIKFVKNSENKKKENIQREYFYVPLANLYIKVLQTVINCHI